MKYGACWLFLLGCTATPQPVPVPTKPPAPKPPPPPTVSLDLHDATVRTTIDEFRRQLPGVTFELVEEGWYEDFRVRELVLRDEPWRSALDAFARAAGAEIAEESESRLRVSRPPRVTLRFNHASLKMAATLLARFSAAKIEVDPDVGGNVTLSVNDRPWRAVLDAIVETLGSAALVQDGEILRVVPAVPVERPRTPPEPARRKKAARGGPKISIQARNAALDDIIAEFRRQVPGMNFELDPDGWEPKLRFSEFIIKAEPWRAALRAFANLAGAGFVEESPTLIRFFRLRRVSFSFIGAPIQKVMDHIARFSAANIVLNADLEGTVSLSVDNQPWDSALRDAARAAGNVHVIRRAHNICCIMPGKAEAAAEPTLKEMLEDLDPPAPSEGERREIDRLIAALASEEIGDRDAAEAKLARMASAMSVVAAAWERAGKDEVKARLERIIRRAWDAM